MEETNEKENIIIPLLQTSPTTPHVSHSNEQNYSIDIPQEESKSVTISFHHINYVIGNEIVSKKNSFQWQMETFPFWKPIPSKQILSNISGIFPPGMNAILGINSCLIFIGQLFFSIGPTGCGKSTLLDILADRKDSRGLSGSVFVSGQTRPSYFKYVIGYVVQNGREDFFLSSLYSKFVKDLMSGTLTVRENLLFSANVRLPNSIKPTERIARVDRVIDDLDLHSCADTLIGTAFVRGVSGGEKKRTSIGMELVLSPNVLFLDEPTTG